MTTAPDQAAPDQATPDQATPDQAAPDQATPDQATPDQATRTRDADLRARAAAAVTGRPAAVEADPWRQAFHIQPPVGLLNDPNGLVWHEGTYHLCYQWHPFAPDHAQKFWAHLTSTDLLTWTWQQPALAPSDPYDKDGCYSGSGIVHDGAVHFLYTGNVRGPNRERWPHQNLATLQPDGTVAKHPDNPVIPPLAEYTGDVRDPKVWSAHGAHWMVLGARTLDNHGTVLLQRSEDLVEWSLVGRIAGGAAEPLGYMWECPDVVHLDGRDVLVISPQHDHGEQAGAGRFTDETLYSVGHLDLGTGRFSGGGFSRVDAGPDFYAPQTFVDGSGRTIMVGWMGMPDHEGQPDLATKHPTVANGWVHCLTVPRVLGLAAGQLTAWPVAELESLRGDPAHHTAALAGDPVALPGIRGTAVDLLVRVKGGPVEIALREGTDHPVLLTLDPAGTATLDRSRIGTGEGGSSTGSFPAADAADARILLDHSSVEVFVDGGRLVMSARIYPDPGADAIMFRAPGAAATVRATCYPVQNRGA